MPNYEYECGACGHGFEIFQSMTDPRLKKCPKCGKLKLHRLIGTGSGIIFKGTGFYETDYKKKEPARADAKDSGTSEKAPSPSSEAKSSAKSAVQSEPKADS